jgi:hypothetical protein
LGDKRQLRRTDLFLIRLWTQEVKDAEDVAGGAEWHGKVQRVVDGEAHQFEDWQSLVDLLRSMLTTSRVGRTNPDQR